MLLSGSLHRPQTTRDTSNQLVLLLLLVCPVLSLHRSKKRLQCSFFFSLPLSLSHTQSQIQHPMTFHFPQYKIHFSKNGDNYLIVCPPPQKKAIIYKSSSCCISVSTLRHFWGPCQLHSRNAGPSISNWLLGRRVLVVYCAKPCVETG